MNAPAFVDETQTAPKTQVAWPHIVLGILGILVSIYAIWAHGQIAAGQDAGCGISDTISCDAVLSSKWAKFAGIPLGYFGALFWAIVIITAISGSSVSTKSAALQRLAVACAGLATSIFLFTVSEFLIRKICPICLTTHILSLLNFAFAVAGWRRARTETPVQNHTS